MQCTCITGQTNSAGIPRYSMVYKLKGKQCQLFYPPKKTERCKIEKKIKMKYKNITTNISCQCFKIHYRNKCPV